MAPNAINGRQRRLTALIVDSAVDGLATGARTALVVVTPQHDGTLAIDIKGQHHAGAFTAVRPE
jgi:hypothetical protein